MLITDSNFNLIFHPTTNIRESIFDIEKELSEFFPKPFNLIPLPNEAPPDIPRITATSHHGFSTLSISLNQIQFSTNFNDDFSSDWNKCKAYIVNRIFKIRNILKTWFKSEPLYCGITIKLLNELQNREAIELLLNNFIKIQPSGNIYDLLSKYTFVFDDNYYVNIQVQNQRLLTNQLIKPGELQKIERTNLIGISLDVNDRYGFNYIPNYSSDDNKINRILEISDNLLINKLEKFIMNGDSLL
jgi:hypothetical protein